MSWYSALLRKVALPWVLGRDGRRSALDHWREYDRSQYWPYQKLADYQRERLKKLIDYAYCHSPYYTTLMDERGLTPKSFKSPDDLKLLPPLSRDILLTRKNDIMSDEYVGLSLPEVMTGGTTGQQAGIYRDNESLCMKMAMAWRHESWMGRLPCDKMAYFWPPHIDFAHGASWKTRLKDRYLTRETMFYAGMAHDEVMQGFYDRLIEVRPEFLKVFPGPLAGFVRFLVRNKLSLRGLKAIMSTGEVLFDEQRQTYEEVFDCPLFDMYGSRETGNTSSECSAHEGLHIAMETSLVEFVKDGVAVDPGTKGEILITDLTNYAFPMIRYQINDYGVPLSSACSCGRELPLMSPGVSRFQDDIYSPDGTRHSGLPLGVHIVTDLEHRIGQIQIRQKSLTDFHILITRTPEPTAATFDFIRARMGQLLGGEINVTIETVDEIPISDSGKVRFVICEIDPPPTD